MTATALDPRTALVVVDLQKAVLGFPYTHPIEAVTANAGRLAAAFRQRDLPVVLTTVGGPPATPTRIDMPFTLPMAELPADWADPVADLMVSPGDHQIVKRRWGSFTNTDLEEHLRGLEVTQIVLAGVATGFGVESTARHASELGFAVTVAVDAITDMDAEIHTNSVNRIFPRLGQCGSTQEILSLMHAPEADRSVGPHERRTPAR